MKGARHVMPQLQRGLALVICLVLLAAVMIFGAAAANIATEGEKGARAERDRQLAFHAAQAALRDAELDIEASPDPARSRSIAFAQPGPATFIAGCGAGDDNLAQGLCQPADAGIPVWASVDLLDQGRATARTVAYGRFTGRTLATGLASLPARLPRYIIELLPYRLPGAAADGEGDSWLFRITAIGFGANPSTHVVLQSHYRREASCCG
ncbi:pilus assembly PilX family protein [Lacisediminimonas profundi]|uniref:pilus assembly PilX family protein n=1 Tax=Lacisediminimonas profundi TaxID=2603856 RepID=UPI001F4F2A2E|nr:PilX N-terminal domain-containing pilus assembly protein [Lacisediminimonas profundi]